MTKLAPEADEPLFRLPLGVVMFCLLAISGLIAVYFVADTVSPAASPASQIRIRNNTVYPFHRVVVNDQPYGDIGAGQSSGYHTLPVAYRYARVGLVAGTRVVQLVPDDYVGERPLGHGRFTYVLSMDGSGQIELGLEKDAQ